MIDDLKFKSSFFSFLKSDKYTNLLLFFFFFLSILFIFNKVTDNLFLEQKFHSLDDNNTQKDIVSEKNIFYDSSIFQPATNLKSDRTFQSFKGGETRHKLRWLYRDIESKIYKSIFQIIGTQKLFVFTIINTSYLFLSFLFTFLTISFYKKKYSTEVLIISGFFYLLLISLSISTNIQSIYTIPEVFFISAGIYFATISNIILFLVPLFFAVINRESGIALSFVYLILNHKNKLSYFVPIISVFILLFVNFDLITNKNTYNLSTYFPIKEGYSDSILSKAEIFVFILYLLNFSILFYVIYIYKKNDYKFFQFSLISLLYFLVATFGTNLTNVYSLLLLAPSLTFLFVLSFSNIKLINNQN